jgi:hypothetical protein
MSENSQRRFGLAFSLVAIFGFIICLYTATAFSEEYRQNTGQVIYQKEQVFDNEGNLMETRVTGKPFLEENGRPLLSKINFLN